MTDDVVERLRRLAEERNADRRGAKFEELLSEAFETAGFLVQSNDTKTARGRECDLVASNDHHTFLVEAKWKQRPIDLGALDSLRARLSQAPRGAIGCVFSRSGFQRGFLDAVQRCDEHHILLFEGRELLHVLGSPTNLNDALQDKLQDSRRRAARSGFVPTITPVAGAKAFGPSRLIRLRVGEVDVRRLHIRAKNGFSVAPALFAREWGDPLWETSCEMRASAFDLDSLAEVFRLMRRTHQAGLDGAFAIYGPESTWTGFGVGNLLVALKEGDRRYEADGVPWKHHSEEFTYLATANCGAVSVVGRRRLRGQETIDSVRVRFELPGVPADTGKFEELRRRLKSADCYFTRRDRSPSVHVNVPRKLKLEVIGDVIDKSLGVGCDVGGIVVKKRFFSGARLPKFRSEVDNSAPKLLRTAEALICDLRDWHDDGDVADYYYLTDIHFEWVAGVLAVRPRATWNTLTKRVTPSRRRRDSSKVRAKNRAFEQTLDLSSSQARRAKVDDE